MADKKRKSSEEEIAEIRAELQEASRLLKEHIADSKARSKEREEENERQRNKDRAAQEKRSRKIDKQLEELGNQIGGAHNRWGKIVEELLAGDLSAIVRTHLNAETHHLSTRVRDDSRSWEIDVLVTNGDIAVPAEVKTTLSIDHIDKFVSRILTRFTALLPQHQGKRIYGVIAFVKTDGNESEVIAHALKQGLIIVKAMHGTNKVLNDKQFKPRDYCPRH